MDQVNSITPTSTDEDQNKTTVDKDGEQIDDHQTDIGDGLVESHTDAYVEHSSDPESLDHDTGTSDVDYWDDEV